MTTVETLSQLTVEVLAAEHAKAPYGGAFSFFDACDVESTLDDLSTNQAWAHLGQNHHAPRCASVVTLKTRVFDDLTISREMSQLTFIKLSTDGFNCGSCASNVLALEQVPRGVTHSGGGS